MALFHFIFSIIFTPIRWFVNLLTRPKNNLLEWHFSYGPYLVNIQTNHKEQFLADDLLIAAYILFLSRYFYICDERQINIVREFLLNTVRKSQKLEIPKLYEIIFKTLNPTERDVAVKLSYIWGRIGPGFPPLIYSEDKEPSRVFAKYSFFVFERTGGHGLGSIFHMSTGPDIILLPLTVGILYDYVVNKLRDKGKKEELNYSVIDLFEKHKIVDCRSRAALIELPNEVISNNNLDYGNF
jgi:hypothetical protein